MCEGVVLQAEQAHIVGQVQFHPRGWVGALTGAEPAVWALLPAALHYIPWPTLRHTFMDTTCQVR